MGRGLLCCDWRSLGPLVSSRRIRAVVTGLRSPVSILPEITVRFLGFPGGSAIKNLPAMQEPQEV